jgi:hypothetical protein
VVSARAIRQIKSAALWLGIALLGVAALVFIAMLAGVVTAPQQFFAGESTVHSIARVAIVGCLLAAVGSMK